jgi:hypothetical protein
MNDAGYCQECSVAGCAQLEIILFVRDVFQGSTWMTADASVILLRIK